MPWLDLGGVVNAAASNPAHHPAERHDRPPRARRVSRPPVPASLPAPRVLRNRRRAGLVLIVDDSLHTRELYSEYLTYRGLGVLTAPDGEAGVALALAMKPDVIVMDLAMPGLNGITATHRLREHPRTRRIPVIVLTGYAFRAIQQGALEAGANVFLTKPCLPEDLERSVRDLLGRARR
ncbi:MAG TPA: response regulator [Methylomirabilota bacterium]|jgi:two-component system cell cycle response regulator DivK|nr:response regulator [Methylomirabilota bacterium]